jgi:hypothetical protein
MSTLSRLWSRLTGAARPRGRVVTADPERVDDASPPAEGHYAVLGVTRAATDESLKRAFRRAAMRAHPDVTGDGGARFRAINLAYSVLSDPELRGLYDAGDTEALEAVIDARRQVPAPPLGEAEEARVEAMLRTVASEMKRVRNR